MTDHIYLGETIYTGRAWDGKKWITSYKIRGISGSYKTLAAAKKRVREVVRKEGRGSSKKTKKLYGKRK